VQTLSVVLLNVTAKLEDDVADKVPIPPTVKEDAAPNMMDWLDLPVTFALDTVMALIICLAALYFLLPN
jgi:hypothetical protein